MKLVYYPNDILNKPCEPVTQFDDELKTIVDIMKDVMSKNKGVGLSANQIGISKQILIMRDSKGIIHEMINPVLLDTQGIKRLPEGCLSAPGVYLDVDRPETIIVEYYTLANEKKRVLAEALEARIILHEMDHLSGIFYFSKVNRATRKRAQAQLKKNLHNLY